MAQEKLAQLFDELATVADEIRRGCSLDALGRWLRTDRGSRSADGRRLLQLLDLMDQLEIF